MGQQLETMLRRCAALCTSAGIKSAELGFRLMHSQIPASGAELKLKQLQGHAQRSLVSCCICSKHGFHPSAPVAEVSLVFWTGVFLSPGRKNLCDRKGNRPKAG